MAIDWVIIGGGIHGVHIAARLLGEACVSPDDLRIIDPEAELLARWRFCTRTTGMTHLRSPSVHNIDINPMSLQRFAGKRRKQGCDLFIPPYDRPSLALFNMHCDLTMDRYGLKALHLRARAIAGEVTDGGVRVRLSTGEELMAHNLVLAIGASEQPEWPGWAPQGHARIQHMFDPGFEGYTGSDEVIAVIGGGISAVQVALELSNQGKRVHLISRHAIRQHQFDSDPGWLGPKFMAEFSRVKCPNHRRVLIGDARHLGSVPPEVARQLRFAIREGKLEWHECEVASLKERGGGVSIHFRDDSLIHADRVLLATGFASHRPGGPLVDSLVESASLPCADCGYPVIDSTLRWHQRIFTSGPLAELELGPASRNIAGARRAADVIVDLVRGSAEYRGTVPYSHSGGDGIASDAVKY